MRISQAVVQKIANYAKEVSDGEFRLAGIGGDLGHGVRYIDGRSHIIWLGKSGNVQAASYYHGIVEAYDKGPVSDRPAWVQELGWALRNRNGFEKWHNKGMDEAFSFLNRHPGV
ncbi:hypothetical protein ACFZAM_31790 [Streptomyces sp. NPDC008079]|uniref:hypothetical protein n=1 Tax=Streptomyces sp. NPDC008079 TaxID=3364806 RepID=UPI0036E1A5BD